MTATQDFAAILVTSREFWGMTAKEFVRALGHDGEGLFEAGAREIAAQRLGVSVIDASNLDSVRTAQQALWEATRTEREAYTAHAKDLAGWPIRWDDTQHRFVRCTLDEAMA